MRSTKICLLVCGVMAFGAAGVTRGQDWVIQQTSAPPVIDGLGEDAVWATATVHGFSEFNVVTTEGGDLDGQDDLSVFWKALWDDVNLYIYAEVADDEIVNDDSCNWDDDSISSISIPRMSMRRNIGLTRFRAFLRISSRPLPGTTSTSFCGTNIPVDSTSIFTLGINSYNESDDISQYPQGADTSVTLILDDNRYTLEVAFPWEALGGTPADIIAGSDGIRYGHQ